MSSKEKVLFYVLVPVYRVEKYIRKCIESVLNQTYQNFRLILVDDGSPDASGTICDEFACADERIKVIHQKNMGALAAREEAINYVKTSCYLEDAYVIFLDSDDSLKRNSLKRLSDIIEQENCDMVIYGMDRVLEGEVVIPFNECGAESYLEDDKRKLYKKVFSDPGYNPVCRKAIKADLIPVKNYEKYYKFIYGEDLLRSIDLYKAISTVYFLQESLYNYTLNPESVTMSVSPNNYKADFTIREKVYEYLKTENVFFETDWEEYRGVCASLISQAIATVSSFDITNSAKEEYYKKIANSDFYKQNLFGGKFNCSLKDRIVINLFKHRAYCFLNLYGRVRKRYVKYMRRKLLSVTGGKEKEKQ